MKVKSMENERLINALLKHIAPVIRDYQAEHGRSLREEFQQRIATIKDDGSVPDEIANQVAVAARMLAEAPPIVREAEARATEIITQKGEPGVRGLPGLPGPQGERGEPGPRGRDGTGIAGAAISRDGELLLTLSDGVILTLALDKVMDNV